MRISTLVLVIALLVGLGSPALPAAEPAFVMIVHDTNRARALDKKTVADVFLKKRTRWGDESAILPVDLRRTSTVRRQFSESVLNRSVESVRTYWNRKVFSGRGVPPPELESDDAVIEYVAKHRGAIGYVSAGANLKNTDVKIVEVR